MDPRDYGPSLKDTIKNKLVQVVENTCNERYGFILKVRAANACVHARRAVRAHYCFDGCSVAMVVKNKTLNQLSLNLWVHGTHTHAHTSHAHTPNTNKKKTKTHAQRYSTWTLRI